MTLVVGIGLDGYYDDADGCRQVAIALVQQGFTTLLHEMCGSGRVLRVEVAGGDRVVDRWLGQQEARPILRDIAACYKKHDSYASFAYGSGEIPDDIQDLALVRDGPARGSDVTLANSGRAPRVIDLKRSMANFTSSHPQARVALALHRLALVHRLVVSSG